MAEFEKIAIKAAQFVNANREVINQRTEEMSHWMGECGFSEEEVIANSLAETILVKLLNETNGDMETRIFLRDFLWVVRETEIFKSSAEKHYLK